MAFRGESLATQSYARALFHTAGAQGVVQRLIEETKMLGGLLDTQPRLRAFLEGPQIPHENKLALIDATFKDRVNPLLLNLLYMMVDRERAVLLSDILEEFQEVAEQAEGIFPATIFSARELGFQEKLKLKTALEKHTACHLRIRYRVQPSLLGGIVFRFRDVLIDGSVQAGIEGLRRRFSSTEGTTN